MIELARRAAAAAFVAALASLPALAEESPLVKGPPSVAELTFVRSARTYLTARYGTAAKAVAAGYVRYTDPDDTGAISYANQQWHSTDAHHPSQLWYDRSGKLLGADFSVAATSKTRPQQWSISPGRWAEFGEHVHYVVRDPKTGTLAYDKYVPADKFRAAGGDVAHPQAATLVKLHLVPAESDVATIFDFPEIWDLTVWLVPNPNGAFAEKNPLVKA